MKPSISRAIAVVTPPWACRQRQTAIAVAQAKLRAPGDVAHLFGQMLDAIQELSADPCLHAIGPSTFDQNAAGESAAALVMPPPADALAARMLGRHQAKISHQLAGIGEAREIPSAGAKRPWSASVDKLGSAALARVDPAMAQKETLKVLPRLAEHPARRGAGHAPDRVSLHARRQAPRLPSTRRPGAVWPTPSHRGGWSSPGRRAGSGSATARPRCDPDPGRAAAEARRNRKDR